MNILINMFCPAFEGGFSTYNYNILKELKNNTDSNNQYFILLNQKTLNDFELVFNENVHIRAVPNFLASTIPRYLWLQFILPLYIIIMKIDLLFTAMNVSPALVYFMKVKSVVVIHTNLPWLFPQALIEVPWYIKYSQLLMTNITIKIANVIVVNSNTAKNELINIFPQIKNKTKKIYLGIDHKRFKVTNKKELVIDKINIYKEKYFLTVSSIVRYHCFIELFKAYEMLYEMDKNVPKLLCISNVIHRNYNDEILNYLDTMNCADNIIILPGIHSRNLPIVYQNAELYIFSSYCEVFGFTNLEAMACGIPVLTSNKSALPEICQNAALYFDPSNSLDIMEKIDSLYKNNALKRSLIKAGKNQSRKFNWEKTAKETLGLLK